MQVQKGQTHSVGYAVRSRYAVCSRYAVDLANMGGGDAVGTQYAVGVSAKRSTYTVDLANRGGGDHYL